MSIKKSSSLVSVGLDTRLMLKPWFVAETLQEGRDLLDGGAPVFWCRNAVGGLFEEKGKPVFALLFFEKKPELTQGFRLMDGGCKACGKQRKPGQYCRHLAALALSALPESTALPLPLAFQDSPWLVLARHLCRWGQERAFGGPALTRGDDGMALVIPAAGEGGPSMRLCLASGEAKSLRALFGQKLREEGGGGRDGGAPEDSGLIADLFQWLREAVRTETEKTMNRAGRETQGQREEASLWFWAARLALSKGLVLAGERDASGDRFHVSARQAPEAAPAFELFPPRETTHELLHSLGLIAPHAALPSAAGFQRLAFGEDGASLLAIPMARLSDGRVFPLPEIEPGRFGRHYYLAGEGWFTVEAARHPFSFREDAAAALPGLFGMAESSAASLLPRAVAGPEVEGFLKRNREAIHAPENEVDAAIRELVVVDEPERLSFHFFESAPDWCTLSAFYGLGDVDIALHDLLAARARGVEVLPGRGRWLKTRGGPFEWLHGIGAERLVLDEHGKPCAVRLLRRELLSLAASFPDLSIDIKDPGQRDSLGKLVDPERWQDYQALPELPPHLREYQKNGIAWLNHLKANNLGGILADDMGLGKTHQALGLMHATLAEDHAARFLVVTPATVAPHWLAKAREFFPGITCALYHGQGRDADILAATTLVVTTYGMMRQDVELLAGQTFAIVFFDEAQQLKNRRTAVFAAAASLNARTVVALTGTPLENSVRDLKALLDLCVPGLLGSDARFEKDYVIPIEERGEARARATLLARVRPFCLRRNRDRVLTELPPVIEDIRTCELSEEQVGLYRQVVASRGREVLAAVERARPGAPLPHMEILAVITMLKQICNHPALLDTGGDAARRGSGKWELFREILAECLDAGMKVVVFSQFTKMLDIIEGYLAEQGIGFAGVRGSMPLKKRKAMIERFNAEPGCRVFSASLLASGVGVDLTAAQAVIHYDRWWNAAREEQATARVHRMGQMRVVEVFKLVTVGTLEEKIHQLIAKKRTMAEELIVEDDEHLVKKLTHADLAALFSL